jgi:acyl carrier protein
MDIKNAVRQFIVKHFYVANPGSLSDEVSLLENGIIDSTGVLEVITFIEGTFGVAVEDDEMLPDNLDSIARIAAFVMRKRAASQIAS